MIISGHCWSLHHNDEIAHNIILWKPKFGTRNGGRYSYIENLKEDTDLDDIYEIRKVMIDRVEITGRGRTKIRKK